MNIRWPWRRKRIDSELASLDDMLSAVLQPVAPRSDFLENLRLNLLAEERRRILGLSREMFQKLLLAYGALVSGAVLLATGLRTIISLIGALGLLRRARRNEAGDSPSIDE